MSFVQELKRRNVVRVGVLYVVAAWLILQAAELLFDAMSVPSEWLRFIIAILVLGLPLVLVFSWVFELTPEGVKLEKDIDRDSSITPQTGQRMNAVIIVLLIVAVATVALDRLMPEQAAESVAAAVEEAIVETGAAENSIAVLPFADLSADGDRNTSRMGSPRKFSTSSFVSTAFRSRRGRRHLASRDRSLWEFQLSPRR